MYTLTSTRACKILHATRGASRLSKMMTDKLTFENNLPGKDNVALSIFSTRENFSNTLPYICLQISH